MRRFISLFIIVIAAFASISARSAPLSMNEPETYLLTLEIDADAKAIGRPQFVVASGSTATAIKAAVDGYSLKARLDPLDTARVRLSSELYLPVGGKWVPVGRPVLTVGIDRTTSVLLPGPAGTAVRMQMRVSRDFSGKFAATTSFGKNRCTSAALERWTSAMAAPVAMAVATQLTDTDSTQKCCKPCAVMTCCSDGPMCCSETTAYPGGGSCCN